MLKIIFAIFGPEWLRRSGYYNTAYFARIFRTMTRNRVGSDPDPLWHLPRRMIQNLPEILIKGLLATLQPQ